VDPVLGGIEIAWVRSDEGVWISLPVHQPPLSTGQGEKSP
jgi:hypothetical protein